jgi:hypothetical protein
MNQLEKRVQRLEDAVSGLQDTRQLEERVVQRVSERLSNNHVREATIVQTAVTTAPRLPAPRVFDAATAAGSVRRAARSLFDACGDLRSIVRMFFDRRYPLGWSVRLLPLVALAAIFLSWWLLGSIWIIGPWLDKIVDLLLAVFVYRVLSCEAARYRQAVGDDLRGR